jgi:hypothetical protein
MKVPDMEVSIKVSIIPVTFIDFLRRRRCRLLHRSRWSVDPKTGWNACPIEGFLHEPEGEL